MPPAQCQSPVLMTPSVSGDDIDAVVDDDCHGPGDHNVMICLHDHWFCDDVNTVLFPALFDGCDVSMVIILISMIY